MPATFSDIVKKAIVAAQNGRCHRCSHPIHSIHHKLNNTKSHRKMFPFFLNSPMNAVGLCLYCHDSYAHLYRVTDAEAAIYEAFLEGLTHAAA